jgi:hypothetical protein
VKLRHSTLPVGSHVEIDELFPLLEAKSRSEVGLRPPASEKTGETDGTAPERKGLAGKSSSLA